jgi:hypothetical protein
MTNSGETQPDLDTEMSYTDAINRKQIVGVEEPVEPKDDVQEAPGSLTRESAGE